MEDQLSFDNTIRTTVGNLSRIVNITVSVNFPTYSLSISLQSDFTSYLRRLYLFANVSLIDTDIVTVVSPKVLRDILSIINRQSSRTIQNYMIWRFMMNRAWYMPKKFRDIVQQYNHVFGGTSTEQSRPGICADYVNGVMGLAVSKIYINQYFDRDGRKEVQTIISH
jgi:membrane metallo-endopeptidase-like protein 1